MSTSFSVSLNCSNNTVESSDRTQLAIPKVLQQVQMKSLGHIITTRSTLPPWRCSNISSWDQIESMYRFVVLLSIRIERVIRPRWTKR